MAATGTGDERHDARRAAPSHRRQRAVRAVLGALSLVAVLLGTLTVAGAGGLPQPAPVGHTLAAPGPSAGYEGVPEPAAVPGHASTAVPGQAAPQQPPRDQHAPAGQTGGVLPGHHAAVPVLPGGNTAPDAAGRPHAASGWALPDVRGPPTTAGA